MPSPLADPPRPPESGSAGATANPLPSPYVVRQCVPLLLGMLVNFSGRALGLPRFDGQG